MYIYRIGDVLFCLKENGLPVVQDAFMERFQAEGAEIGDCDVIYECVEEDLSAYGSETLVNKNETYELYEVGNRHLMVYHWARCRFGFGYWLEQMEQERTVRCYLHPDIRAEVPLSAIRFFSCTGMHSKLLQLGGMVLHASYVDWEGVGILFAAASGTGKSTQAELWAQYAGAGIINEDRVLLRRKNDVWYAYGYPCCGSSDICINRTRPVRMIVVLGQDDKNRIAEMTAPEKIRALLTGTEVYVWNQTEVERALYLTERMIMDIPVVKYGCLPDQSAVWTLQEYMKEV